MSASGKITFVDGSETETEDTCRIVVFYEDNWARARAMSLCERLVDQFAEDLDFEFKWWKFKRLGDQALAQHATAAATAADIVLFCPHNNELSPEASDWLDSWSEAGVNSGGAIALVVAGRTDSEAATKLTLRIKSAAVRLGMDLLHLPVPPAQEMGLAGGKLAPPFPTPPVPHMERPMVHHWGLNE